MKLIHKTVDGEILIRDTDVDGPNPDLVAIVPLTGDEDWDREVLGPFAETICKIPHMLQTIEAAEVFLTALSECKPFVEAVELHVDEALEKLRKLLKGD